MTPEAPNTPHPMAAEMESDAEPGLNIQSLRQLQMLLIVTMWAMLVVFIFGVFTSSLLWGCLGGGGLIFTNIALNLLERE